MKLKTKRFLQLSGAILISHQLFILMLCVGLTELVSPIEYFEWRFLKDSLLIAESIYVVGFIGVFFVWYFYKRNSHKIKFQETKISRKEKE